MIPEMQLLEKKIKRLQSQNRWLRWITICILLSTVFVFAFSTFGQRPVEAIYFGAQGFERGMPKGEALARLAECCKLTGRQDSVFVETKNGPPFKILGSIEFHDDTVSRLRLNLDQFQNESAAELGLLFFRKVSEMTHSKPKSVILMTQTTEAANATIRALSLTVENERSLVIEANTSDPNKAGARDWVDVYEVLQ